MDVGDSHSAEKSRICPSCRMAISVLAVRCRFCGEEIGRPKEEQRTLSINDLGGEIIHHRAPSGSVMEALEAFRVETGLEGDESAIPGHSDGAGNLSEDGVPTVDDDAFGEEFGSATKSSITSVHEKRPPTFQERFKIIGLIVGAITLLVFIGAKTPGWIDTYRGDADAVVTTYVNKAPGILERGGPPLDALRAAVDAIKFEDSAPHRKSAEDALSAVADEVHGLLSASPFDQLNLSSASRLATRAMNIYPGERTVELVEEVKGDSTVYKMLLIKIDRETKTATFKPNLPGSPNMHVKKGEILADRFRVRLVSTRGVTLEDQLRGNRTVRFEVGGGPL